MTIRVLQLIADAVSAPEVMGILAFAIAGAFMVGAFYLFVKAWFAI